MASASEPEKTTVELVTAETRGKHAVKLSWTKVPGATKYYVYGQICDEKFEKLTVTKKTSCVIRKIKGSQLQAHACYKFYVAAYNGSKKIATSKKIHFITANTLGKYANAKKISVQPANITLQPGETVKLRTTKKIYQNKKHIQKSHGTATRYMSDRLDVAKVRQNGIVTAIAPGEATIYIQDIGGEYCTTTVTVMATPPNSNITMASAYGDETGGRTATGDVIDGTSVGVCIPISWSNYRSYFGRSIMITYNGQTVLGVINDCGVLGDGNSISLQPGIIRAFGFKDSKSWGLREVTFIIN